MTRGSPPGAVHAALILAGMAVGAWALSFLHLVPMAAFARAASADGALDAPYVQLLADAQRWLTPCLLVGAILAVSSPRWLAMGRRALDACPGWLFGSVLMALGALPAWWVQQGWFEGVPHVTDAISHVFQAKIFASGHVVAPAPACPSAFFADNILIRPQGVWHTKYFPGTALWLAAWLRAGLLAWALPVAWGATLCGVSRTIGLLYSRLAGRMTALLLVTSPMGILLAGSFMSHTLAVFWLATAAWALAEGLRRRRSAWYLLAGAAAAASVITRPQDLPAAGVLALGALWCASPESRRELWRALLPGLAGALLPLLLLAAWNRVVFGAWLASGYNFGTTLSVTPVIRDSIGFTEWFTPRDAVRHLMWTILRLNKALLGWPASFLLIPLAFCLRRPDRRDLAAAAASLTVVGVYFFFPYYGFEYEARYHIAAAPLLVLLTVRGGMRASATSPRTAALIAGLTVASVLHGLAYYWPRYLAPVYGHAYERVTADVERRAQAAGLANALILLPSGPDAPQAYGAGFLFNDPWLRRPVIYARDLPAQLDCLRDQFGGRAIYRYHPEDGRFEPVALNPQSGT